mgnify:CR=1 FL=1
MMTGEDVWLVVLGTFVVMLVGAPVMMFRGEEGGLLMILVPSDVRRANACLHYAKSYRPFELFVNENYKL